MVSVLRGICNQQDERFCTLTEHSAKLDGQQQIPRLRGLCSISDNLEVPKLNELVTATMRLIASQSRLRLAA